MAAQEERKRAGQVAGSGQVANGATNGEEKEYAHVALVKS